MNEINMDRFLDGIQISTRIIKDATGVVFIAMINGAINSRIRIKRDAKTAVTTLHIIDRKKPPVIRKKEKQTALINSFCKIK